MESGAAKTGRNADRSTWRIAREVYIAETTEQARAEAINGTMGQDFAGYFLRTLPRLKMLGLMKNDPDMPDSEVTLECLAERGLDRRKP